MTMHPGTPHRVSEHVTCLVAHNPSAMTLQGTNTYVVGAHDAAECLVIDPGPGLPEHLDAITDHVGARRVVGILITHRHHDHAELAAPLTERTGAPIYAVPSTLDAPCAGNAPTCQHDACPTCHPEVGASRLPSGRSRREALIPIPPSTPLAHGNELTAAGVTLTVISTPGHTHDSLSLTLLADSVLFTGDTVLGSGSTVVAWPDGNLGEYLSSLEALEQCVKHHRIRLLAPGHGPIHRAPATLLEAYRRHRHERLRQVREALRNGVSTEPRAIVEAVYDDVPPALWPAAELSVRAQLDYLRDEGQL